jgi:hypothetical protein
VQHESVITTKWEQTIKGQNNPLKKIIIKPFLFQPVFFYSILLCVAFFKKEKNRITRPTQSRQQPGHRSK